MWRKSNETNFLFTKILIFFKHQYYQLQNSSLRRLHTDGDDVPPFGRSAGSLLPVWSSACPLNSFGCFLKSRNRSFEGVFKFRKKSQRLRPGEGNRRNAFWGQNFCDEEDNVTWGIVMMEHPFVYYVWSHANVPFSEPFKDVFIKISNEIIWKYLLKWRIYECWLWKIIAFYFISSCGNNCIFAFEQPKNKIFCCIEWFFDIYYRYDAY